MLKKTTDLGEINLNLQFDIMLVTPIIFFNDILSGEKMWRNRLSHMGLAGSKKGTIFLKLYLIIRIKSQKNVHFLWF